MQSEVEQLASFKAKGNIPVEPEPMNNLWFLGPTSHNASEIINSLYEVVGKNKTREELHSQIKNYSERTNMSCVFTSHPCNHLSIEAG